MIYEELSKCTEITHFKLCYSIFIAQNELLQVDLLDNLRVVHRLNTKQ